MDRKFDYLVVLGRIMLAALFLWSGLGKLMSYEGTVGYISSVGLPLAPLGYLIAVGVEIGGGIALVVGFKTRIVAAVFAVYALATALSFHMNFGDLNQATHFFKNISIAGGMLHVFAFGGGALSFDRWLQSRYLGSEEIAHDGRA
jgi:putative oxidoreductase